MAKQIAFDAEARRGLEAGEGPVAVSRDTGIPRKTLVNWRTAQLAGDPTMRTRPDYRSRAGGLIDPWRELSPAQAAERFGL